MMVATVMFAILIQAIYKLNKFSGKWW